MLALVKSLSSAGAGRGTIAKIALYGLILPQLLITLALDVHSVSTVEALRLNADSLPPNAGYLELLAPGLSYASSVGFAGLLEFFFIIATYFALTGVAIDRWRGGDTAGPAMALRMGMKKALRAIIPFGVLILFLGTVGQVLTAVSMLVASLVLVAPAIMLVEKQPTFRAIANATFVRYARRAGFGIWTVLLALLTFAAIAYTLLFTVAYGREWLLSAEHWLLLPEAMANLIYGTQPLSPLYVGVTVIDTLFVSAILTALPLVTAAVYLLVIGAKSNQRSLGSA